jgi:hypothetical protein
MKIVNGSHILLSSFDPFTPKAQVRLPNHKTSLYLCPSILSLTSSVIFDLPGGANCISGVRGIGTTFSLLQLKDYCLMNAINVLIWISLMGGGMMGMGSMMNVCTNMMQNFHNP